jgi:inosine-uridine nucleoside N-ribohydrolase
LAIGLALARPELRVLAVTTVGGNADVRHCTENALRLLHAYGRDDIPVAEGAAGPLVGDVVRATEVHGEGGIGTTQLEPATARAREGAAVELIAQILRDSPEPVAITPIGPLTNIALLLRLYPGLESRIAHLSIMGGSIGEGNTTVSAEFNVYADPEAADIVFRSGLPITMMGLDVTHQALLDRRSVEALMALGTRSGRIAGELTAYALDRNAEWSGATTTAIHDAVAVAHLAIGDLVDVALYHVAVDTTDGPARGRTICDGLPFRLRREGRSPNAEVGIRIDRERFEGVLVDAFSRLP